MQCTECGTRITLPSSPKITTVTCNRCGDVSMRGDGDSWRRMYPALHMYPFHCLMPQGIESPEAVVSRWMPTHTRPVTPGTYQCRFRTTGEAIFSLHWDGTRFALTLLVPACR